RGTAIVHVRYKFCGLKYKNGIQIWHAIIWFHIAVSKKGFLFLYLNNMEVLKCMCLCDVLLIIYIFLVNLAGEIDIDIIYYKLGKLFISDTCKRQVVLEIVAY
ncbi:hypothetical protein ACJX0J_039962, partial [Zea mays]